MWPPTGLNLGSQKLREILTLLCCITLSSSREKPTQCSRGSKKDFWRRCRGGLCTSQDIPSTHHKLISLALHYFPFASRFPLPHFTLAILFALSFPFASLFCLPLVCLCVGLLIKMAQDNTKLCDFSNTNNNDFISTPIAPLTDAESCEINTALLNLVMKVRFPAFLVKMPLPI